MQVRQFDTGAVRDADADAARYDLIAPEGMRRLAETYAEGAQKYDDHNWRKGMPFSATANHAIRHVFKWLAGQTDEDHLAHAAWGLFALMEFEQTHPELDDRYFKPVALNPIDAIKQAAAVINRETAERAVGLSHWRPTDTCQDPDCEFRVHYIPEEGDITA